MRLIDADKLLEETRKDRDYARKNGFLDMYYERQVLIDRIESQPTAYDVDKLAEWLEELKDHRERECNHINETLYDKGYSDGYNKAIEYFVMLFKSKTSMENSLVDEIAEQLKEGEENEQR